MSTAASTGRLLVVDDDQELATALRDGLREVGFDVSAFTDPRAALAALKPGDFDLLLSDLTMPGTDGIELLRLVLATDPAVAGVIMTGQGSVQTAVEAMRAGALDFLVKPFRLDHALPVIHRALAAGRMRAENDRLRAEVARLEAERVRGLEESNARLAALAVTDPLTGLANRRAFDDTLARESALAERGTRALSLALFDVDHFKAFNDGFGHPAGDVVLGQVAEHLRAASRAGDVVARVGGEEFAILLPGADLDGAVALAERVRELVAAGPWPNRPVTVSAGVAVCRTGDGSTLVAAADRALYQAKRLGRNRVETADQPTRGARR